MISDLVWYVIFKTQEKKTDCFLVNALTNLTKCDDFPLILSLLFAKEIFFPQHYALYDTFSENNQNSPFRGKHVNKRSAVPTSFPE